MLGEVDDGEIAFVIGVGEMKSVAAWRLEPLQPGDIAVAGQEADA